MALNVLLADNEGNLLSPIRKKFKKLSTISDFKNSRIQSLSNSRLDMSSKKFTASLMLEKIRKAVGENKYSDLNHKTIALKKEAEILAFSQFTKKKVAQEDLLKRDRSRFQKQREMAAGPNTFYKRWIEKPLQQRMARTQNNSLEKQNLLKSTEPSFSKTFQSQKTLGAFLIRRSRSNDKIKIESNHHKRSLSQHVKDQSMSEKAIMFSHEDTLIIKEKSKSVFRDQDTFEQDDEDKEGTEAVPKIEFFGKEKADKRITLQKAVVKIKREDCRPLLNKRSSIVPVPVAEKVKQTLKISKKFIEELQKGLKENQQETQGNLNTLKKKLARAAVLVCKLRYAGITQYDV